MTKNDLRDELETLGTEGKYREQADMFLDVTGSNAASSATS